MLGISTGTVLSTRIKRGLKEGNDIRRGERVVGRERASERAIWGDSQGERWRLGTKKRLGEGCEKREGYREMGRER